MKNKILILLVVIGCNMHAYTVNGKNTSNNKFAVDFLDSSGNSHANMVLNPSTWDKYTDERDIGGWCIEKVRATIIKPNGGYGGMIEVKVPSSSCKSYNVDIGQKWFYEIGWVELYVHEAGGFANLPLKRTHSRGANYTNSLLNVTTENSIITNNTNAVITLSNAPSLGSGATNGVPIAPGATIPFYLNAGSAGEELVVKGNGAGTVSFGNDYAKHKTTWIGSTNISGFQVIDGKGHEIYKKLDAKAQLVIDPLERVDITTPAGDWEIRLKVAEEIVQ